MVDRNRHYSSLLALLIPVVLSTSSASADTGLTPEQQTNLTSLIYITIASSVVTAVVSLRHYWRSTLRDWTIIFQSISMVSVVTFVCFIASLAPLVRLLDIKETVYFLYFPSIVFAFLLLAISMWIRTVLNEQILAYAMASDMSLDVDRVKKSFWLWQRERRIARSKRYWTKRAAMRKASELKALQSKQAAKNAKKR